jgi:cell division protein ZapA
MLMGQVTVAVNGRSYTVTCDDGQEARIRRLAQYVDGKVAEFVTSLGQVGEARLLLLAALVVADELSDAKETLERERDHAQSEDAERSADADALAEGIHDVAKRVEAIATRLETP